MGFPRPPATCWKPKSQLARQMISSGSARRRNGFANPRRVARVSTQIWIAGHRELDPATRAALALDSAPLTNYLITSNDLARLQPVSKTWLGKSQQTALDYETILELVAEKGHASPNLVRRLNPGVGLDQLGRRTSVRIPDVTNAPPPRKRHSPQSDSTRSNWKCSTRRRICSRHFPCSIAARMDKRPVGELHVAGHRAKSRLHVQPGSVSRIAGSATDKNQTPPATRPQQPRGHRVDQPGQTGLRNARHAQPGAGRAHGITRLFPAGELESLSIW